MELSALLSDDEFISPTKPRKTTTPKGAKASGSFSPSSTRRLHARIVPSARPESDFHGKYHLTDAILGDGMFSVVYHAIRLIDSKDVAVKMISKQFFNNHYSDFDHNSTGGQTEIANIQRELTALQQCGTHQNLIEFLDVFEGDNRLFLVMEKVPGKNLHRILKLERLPEEFAKTIFRGIVTGLQHLHEKHIVHGDIKPHNVIVTELPSSNSHAKPFGLHTSGVSSSHRYEFTFDDDEEKCFDSSTSSTSSSTSANTSICSDDKDSEISFSHSDSHVPSLSSPTSNATDLSSSPSSPLPSSTRSVSVKICDFGFARLLEDVGGHASVKLHIAENLYGTSGYIAPEMLRNRTFSTKIDLWSLGVTLYEMLCGVLPVYANTPTPSTAAGAVPAPKTLLFPEDLNLSAASIDLIRRLMSQKPADRPACDQVLDHPWLKAQA